MLRAYGYSAPCGCGRKGRTTLSGLGDKAKGQGNQVKGGVKETASDIKDTVKGKAD